MNSPKNVHKNGSNSVNKQEFHRESQISVKESSTKRVNDQIKNKNSNKNVLEMIYDDEFVIMINQLSTSIKNYYRANNKNFNIIKSIINKNDDMDDSNITNNEIIIETFNKIENTFSYFYSSAKQIFKNMKIYRREKITNILSNNKKKTTNNNNNILNVNIKHRNSGAKVDQLIKSPIEISSKSIFGNERNKILKTKMSEGKIKNINNNVYNVSEFGYDNNDNSSKRENNDNNNYKEFFNVIDNYSKKSSIKSTTNIKEPKENSISLVNSVKSKSKNKKIFFRGNLNKSDKKPKNKKLSFFINNVNNDKQRVKSTDKNSIKTFETKKIKESPQN